MCFSQEMSVVLVCMGLAFLALVRYVGGNDKGTSRVMRGVFYFILMEVLQVVQYSYIATDIDPHNPTLEQFEASPTCALASNKFLTFLGYLHVAFQPVHTSLLFTAYVTSERNRAQMDLLTRLQWVGGFLFLMRHLLAFVPAETFEDMGIDRRYAFDASAYDQKTEIEWLTGPFLCTYQGIRHLAWSVPVLPRVTTPRRFRCTVS